MSVPNLDWSCVPDKNFLYGLRAALEAIVFRAVLVAVGFVDFVTAEILALNIAIFSTLDGNEGDSR